MWGAFKWVWRWFWRLVGGLLGLVFALGILGFGLVTLERYLTLTSLGQIDSWREAVGEAARDFWQLGESYLGVGYYLNGEKNELWRWESGGKAEFAPTATLPVASGREKPKPTPAAAATPSAERPVCAGDEAWGQGGAFEGGCNAPP